MILGKSGREFITNVRYNGAMTAHEFNSKYSQPIDPSLLDLSPETLAVDATQAALSLQSVANFLRVLDAADGWDDHDWLAAADALDNAADDCTDAANAENGL